MIYTFQISDNSLQSQSIIDMLVSLSKDYDFLKLVDKSDENKEYELTQEKRN